MIRGALLPTRSATPCLDLAGAALATQGRRLDELLDGTSGEGPEEALHDVRVTLRRISTIAWLSRGVPGRGDGKDLHRVSRDLRRRLSQLRTQEVCRGILLGRYASSSGAARSAADRFFPELPGDPLRGAPSDTVEEVRRTLSDRKAAIARLLADAGQAARTEKRLARRLRRRLAQRLRAVLVLLPPAARTLHRARIAAKGFRYALELTSPLLIGARPLIEAAKEFQDAAGEAHDLNELHSTLVSGRVTPRAGSAAEATGSKAAAREAARTTPVSLDGLAAAVRLDAEEALTEAKSCGRSLERLLLARPPVWRAEIREP